MKNKKVTILIIFGVLVHALILKAVLDIYFSSPLDRGMTPIKSTNDPPAKRVVLFVADGLRAEAIYESPEPDIAPNLMKIRNTQGAWGVAHTRVPTESRPGHVALLGGVYEDPAAIFKGWKVNPVDFDSVVNQSKNAWLWGGPSIIKMFNKDNSSHIHLNFYDESMEDFGTNDTSVLDKWVFDRVKTFFNEQNMCFNCKEFKESGNLFFLHLLGIDTAGHGYKPESKEYKENIRFVDKHIVEVEKLFEDTFPDHTTSYIFTSDHGMTNWGSHGAGSSHETWTPIIAWGAGIKKLHYRRDIQQIDIAPLISALLGNNYPINSQGRLPYLYIDTSLENLCKMLVANVYQLNQIFNVKKYKRAQSKFNLKHYSKVDQIHRQIGQIKALMHMKNYGPVIRLSYELMEVLIDGAEYYNNYYQLPLLMSITIGIVEWIIFLATYNVKINKTEEPVQFLAWIHLVFFGGLYSSTVILSRLASLPLMYYLYFLFPIFMLQVLVFQYLNIKEGLNIIKTFGLKKSIWSLFLYGLGLKLLVAVFRRREALSVLMWLLGLSVWMFNHIKLRTKNKHRIPWLVGCAFLSIFPFFEMKTAFSVYYHLGAYIIWWILIDNVILKLTRDPLFSSSDYLNVIEMQSMAFKLTPFYTLAVEYGLITSNSILKHISAWSLYPIILIPCSSTRIVFRITSIFIGFATYYLMVTLNYESLFLVCYVALLYTWLMLETQFFSVIYALTYDSKIDPHLSMRSDDFRVAFYFIVLIFMGFFGTGNIASLSSFDPMWVRCFLTVFSPFKMSALIIAKIVVPFIFATCTYRAIHMVRLADTLHMFCIVLLFSDIMLLDLLYSITNVGSWLEIGTSLSQFIIMEAFVIILLLLYYIAYLLTTTRYNFNFLFYS